MRYVTDNPDVTDEPDNTGDAPLNPAARRTNDPTRNPSAHRANDPAHTPAEARSSDTKSEDKSGDIPAMLDQALEPVLTELGHVRTRLGSIEQTQGQMSDRLDDIEQAQGQMSDRLKSLEQARPAATPPATAQPAAAQQAVTSPAAPPAAAPPAPAPTAAPAPAPAPAPVKSKWNGNGLGIWVQIAVLTIMATIYVAGFTHLGNQIRDVNDRLDSTNARIDSTNQRVTQLGTDLRAEMATIVERIHAMELRLAELFARLDSLARGQTHTDQRLARVEGTLDLPPLPQPPLTDIDSN